MATITKATSVRAVEKPARTTLDYLQIAGVLLVLFFTLFPIFWLALTAFKVQRDAFALTFFFDPTLNNFARLFDGNPYNFLPLIRNSIIVSLSTVSIAIPLACMSAFAFSRYKFFGRDILLVVVLATQFLPAVVVLVPYFIQFRNLGLLDTRISLVIMHLTMAVPFATWLIKGFIDSLPMEIEEAALVDGCHEFQILTRITLPLAMPGIVTATVLTFIQSWNEFLFAFILTKTDRARPMMVGLMGLAEIEGIAWEKMAAASLFVMLPVFVLSLLIRRYFVEGLTMGAVK